MAELLLLPLDVDELRDRHGRLRRVQREQGMLPSHACLIWAQRWQTGRRSVVILDFGRGWRGLEKSWL